MESRKVSIRDARPEELDEVSTVISAAYLQYESSLPVEVWEAYASDIANVRSRLDEAELIVAEHNERLVGSVTFYPRRLSVRRGRVAAGVESSTAARRPPG